MQVELVTHPGEAWDSFGRGSHGFTAFHRAGWERVNRQIMEHETVFLQAVSKQVICGILPLVRVKSRLFGHFLVSMPFVSHGGPLGSLDAISSLVSYAVSMAREAQVDLLELRSRSALDVGLNVSHRKISVLLDLADSPEAQMKAFPAKLRSQVRRAQKEGVQVRHGSDHIADFYRVFSRHMRDLGTPTLPERFFRALASEFGDDVWVTVAYQGDVPIAGGMGFRWGTEFEITWASALREYNRLSPNMLVYWSLMEKAIAERCTIFNFGRCSPGGNTHRFKLQWGGRDETLHWYQWSPRAFTSTPSPDTGAFSLGPRVWRHLPLSIANLVGPKIVRSIP